MRGKEEKKRKFPSKYIYIERENSIEICLIMLIEN